MDWLRQNWFWLVVGVLFAWMHTKMHGGHGHGGHGGHGGQRGSRERDDASDEDARDRNRRGGSHAEH